MKKIDKGLIDSLPSKFTDALVANLVSDAKASLAERDMSAWQYVISNDERQKVAAIHADARYSTYRSILTMLGKQRELLESGNTNE